MDGKKSRFDFACFDSGDFAVNSDKFDKKQAIEMFEYEVDGTIGEKKGEFILRTGYVKWRAGINDCGDKFVGWWLEWKPRTKGSVPVHVFERRWRDKTDGDL